MALAASDGPQPVQLAGICGKDSLPVIVLTLVPDRQGVLREILIYTHE
jgi:hypothetical protein